jgi:hypothetical protein
VAAGSGPGAEPDRNCAAAVLPAGGQAAMMVPAVLSLQAPSGGVTRVTVAATPAFCVTETALLRECHLTWATI